MDRSMVVMCAEGKGQRGRGVKRRTPAISRGSRVASGDNLRRQVECERRRDRSWGFCPLGPQGLDAHAQNLKAEGRDPRGRSSQIREVRAVGVVGCPGGRGPIGSAAAFLTEEMKRLTEGQNRPASAGV